MLGVDLCGSIGFVVFFISLVCGNIYFCYLVYIFGMDLDFNWYIVWVDY